jgi:hypothetical protein
VSEIEDQESEPFRLDSDSTQKRMTKGNILAIIDERNHCSKILLVIIGIE